jgi:flavin-dependent dehydrogenase
MKLSATKKYDAIVIGAGPGGASTARTLVAGGMKTLLIEKKKLPREKICAGLLARDAVNFVNQRFGVIPESVYSQPPFLKGLAIIHSLQSQPVIIETIDPVANIWRSHFDFFLAQSSASEINDELKLDRIERDSGFFNVICKCKKSDTRESFKTRYVVAADGYNSRTVLQLMPKAYEGLPRVSVMQLHYRGKIEIDPEIYNLFFFRDTGTFAWASIKDDRILIGIGNFAYYQVNRYYNNFLALLKKNYNLRIEATLLREGCTGRVMTALNTFVLGKGNLLVVGDAGGFMHALGEGISAALTTGDLAGKSILTAEETKQRALDIYSQNVREEVYKCVDQHNILRMFQNFPMPLDLKSAWRNHSLRQLFLMGRIVIPQQLAGWADIGVARISKRNMIYRLIHGSYPSIRHIGDNFIVGKGTNRI